MVFIYILKLEKGKYYIGKTRNPNFRLENHFNGEGSEWTIKYKPLKLIELIPNCDDYDEDKYVRIYMDKYGISNVRGGTFTSIKLDNATINLLEKMGNSTNDRCFICGEKGHFARECEFSDNSNDDDYNEIEEYWECEKCGKEFTEHNKFLGHLKLCKKNNSNNSNNSNRSITCFRCGREGHYANECYSSRHIKGYYFN